MKFECPNCKKAGQVDDAKVPENGLYANCPQCSTKFLIKRATPKDFEFVPVTEAKPDVIPKQKTVKPSTPPKSSANTQKHLTKQSQVIIPYQNEMGNSLSRLWRGF